MPSSSSVDHGQPKPSNRMDARARVLELPELLSSIFQHVYPDRPSLANAILVDRLWFDCATRVLWAEISSHPLAAIPEHDRRQLYAGKIRDLDFDGDGGPHHVLFRDLQFPSLKSVSVDSYYPEDGQLPVRQYLQSSLEKFHFFGGPLDENTLSYMAAHCFHLRILLMDHLDKTQIDPTFFLDFLSRMPWIEEMILMYGMDRFLTRDLLVSLSRRETLKHLEWGRPVKEDVFEEIVNQVAAPFEFAEDLKFEISSSTVPILIRTTGSKLQKLELTIIENAIDVIKHISILTQLRQLDLSFDPAISLDKKDVMQLKKLSNLRTLRIARAGIESYPMLLEFTDKTFEELVSNLPHLQVFVWGVQCNLSSKSLACLLKRCLSLGYIAFKFVFSLQELLEQIPSDAVFPKVIALRVGGLQANTDATETAHILRRIFPSLTSLDAGYDDFSKSVVDVWEEMVDND